MRWLLGPPGDFRRLGAFGVFGGAGIIGAALGFRQSHLRSSPIVDAAAQQVRSAEAVRTLLGGPVASTSGIVAGYIDLMNGTAVITLPIVSEAGVRAEARVEAEAEWVVLGAEARARGEEPPAAPENRAAATTHKGDDFRKEHQVELHGDLSDVDSEPVLDFSQLVRVDEHGGREPLPTRVQRFFADRGYKAPSAVQAQSFPLALAGRDVVGVAQTGSGKTLGFLVPLFWQVAAARREAAQKGERGLLGPLAVVLAPTRELAQQIEKEAQEVGAAFGCTSVCVFGGQDKRLQERSIAKLRKQLDLVVATPGRLCDFIQMRVLPMHAVRFLVLDEADRMLDMGFEPQLREVVETMPESSAGRQTLMFSATWPREVQQLAAEFASRPVRINIGGGDGHLVANRDIAQHVVVHTSTLSKLEALSGLLSSGQARAVEASGEVGMRGGGMREGGMRGGGMREGGMRGSRGAPALGCHSIVFVTRKRDADMVAADIRDSCQGINAQTLHGDLSQSRRDQVLSDAKTGRVHVLVATDVAARGLDVSTIRQVINFDMPTNMEDYIHRIGRTGRAGNKGEAHTFLDVEKDTPHVHKLCQVLRDHEQPVPPDLQQLANSLQPSRAEPTRARAAVRLSGSLGGPEEAG
ncbi:hypothetical protein Ctob_011398 [Chrysochromulina tobinii]|uniref:RNA helicase n=1 Tax=Chrysochromulina tobinii TaxID=1460289 RepID=A0A0M0K1J5_9EUKA|nr:hypothetical protein Ctob_011398 [Chrysochromulina tobinii]|eukprot:KOO32756.1 hypothetical protein Ctob_011398 [Chrysochromulina sp. CCMP291]